MIVDDSVRLLLNTDLPWRCSSRCKSLQETAHLRNKGRSTSGTELYFTMTLDYHGISLVTDAGEETLSPCPLM